MVMELSTWHDILQTIIKLFWLIPSVVITVPSPVHVDSPSFTFFTLIRNWFGTVDPYVGCWHWLTRRWHPLATQFSLFPLLLFTNEAVINVVVIFIIVVFIFIDIWINTIVPFGAGRSCIGPMRVHGWKETRVSDARSDRWSWLNVSIGTPMITMVKIKISWTWVNMLDWSDQEVSVTLYMSIQWHHPYRDTDQLFDYTFGPKLRPDGTHRLSDWLIRLWLSL